jgi:orotidine-5'-phosphate decarboxylase
MKEIERIIPAERSVIVAADVNGWDEFYNLVDSTIEIHGISAYKIGFSLGFLGLQRAVNIVKKANSKTSQNKKIIFDFQKAGNDIPETGKVFAQSMVDAGVDTVILFPFTGPVTQTAWTMACLDANLKVITGGIMTHSKFLISEGGYISDRAVFEIYGTAARMGCRHFVVPGTKIDWIIKIKALLDDLLGVDNYVLYAPGFINQGGNITECGKVAGKEWHAIVGSAIYKAENIYEAATKICKQIW